MDCYIFDIDGTVATNDHRQHFIERRPPDWDGFLAACGEDTLIEPVARLVRDLAKAGACILYVTGRSDDYWDQTVQWLAVQGLLSSRVFMLFMRKAGDHRPDDLVKADLLDEIQKLGYRVIMVFDDRNSVVKMWRSKGIVCAQVAEGDF